MNPGEPITLLDLYQGARDLLEKQFKLAALHKSEYRECPQGHTLMMVHFQGEDHLRCFLLKTDFVKEAIPDPDNLGLGVAVFAFKEEGEGVKMVKIN